MLMKKIRAFKKADICINLVEFYIGKKGILINIHKIFPSATLQRYNLNILHLSA